MAFVPIPYGLCHLSFELTFFLHGHLYIGQSYPQLTSFHWLYNTFCKSLWYYLGLSLGYGQSNKMAQPQNSALYNKSGKVYIYTLLV